MPLEDVKIDPDLRKPPGKWLVLALLWTGPSIGAVCILVFGGPRWIATAKQGQWTLPVDLVLSLVILIMHVYWVKRAQTERSSVSTPKN